MTTFHEVQHRMKYSYPTAIKGFWGAIIMALILLFAGCWGSRQAGVKSPWVPRSAFALSFVLVLYADGCHRKATEDEAFLSRDRELSNRKHAKMQAHDYFPEEVKASKPEELPEAPPPEIPLEDLAEQMALTTTEEKYGTSILIACPRRTGKSNLLRSAMHRVYQRWNGQVDFFVANGGKDDETYCGLEKTNSYLFAGTDETIDEVHNRLERRTEYTRSYRGFPTIQVLDEYNQILAAAKARTKVDRALNKTLPKECRVAEIDYREMIPLKTGRRLVTGPAKFVIDWMSSHSAFVGDVDINTANRDSVAIIVMARGHLREAIDKVLSNKLQVLTDDQLRERLKTQWDHHYDANDENTVVALTNLMGQWRLVKLPRYPDNQPEIHPFNAPPITVKDDVVDPSVSPSFTVDVSSEEVKPNIPTECVQLLQWISDSPDKESGFIRKSVISQKWHPHRKGLKSDDFHKVLLKLDEMKYIEYDQSTPAKVKVLRLP
ncbi:MAG: hypothetical protein AAF327_18055 [Cyanobacteria bacterium P01_A01_bin.37]